MQNTATTEKCLKHKKYCSHCGTPRSAVAAAAPTIIDNYTPAVAAAPAQSRTVKRTKTAAAPPPEIVQVLAPAVSDNIAEPENVTAPAKPKREPKLNKNGKPRAPPTDKQREAQAKLKAATIRAAELHKANPGLTYRQCVQRAHGELKQSS